MFEIYSGNFFILANSFNASLGAVHNVEIINGVTCTAVIKIKD